MSWNPCMHVMWGAFLPLLFIHFFMHVAILFIFFKISVESRKFERRPSKMIEPLFISTFCRSAKSKSEDDDDK